MNRRTVAVSFSAFVLRASGSPPGWLGLALVLAATAGLAGCTPAAPPTGSAPGAQESGVTNYPGRGVIQALPEGGKSVVIRHEAFPGFMEAMTMPFEVRDPRELVGLKPGDKVDFQLHVTATDGWADHFLVVTNTATAGAPAPPPAPEPAVGPLSPGDLVPDYPLTNQLGRAFQLGEFRGHAVALDFIFTRCPYPTFCPLLSRNFAAAQKRLAADPGLANCRLLSISFDPAHDTPERLRDYGVAYHQDSRLWTLATGELPVLVRLAGHFGLYFSANAEPAAQNHNLRTVVLDPKGRVARVFIGNEWSPDELVEELRKASEPSR